MAIRRALGASCFGVGAALSRRSLIWALFAGLLSCPPAYVTIEHWLRNYAYRIDIGIVPFATGTLAALFAASFSLAYTSLRASSLAPTEELRENESIDRATQPVRNTPQAEDAVW